jgi:hypothetical protein
MWEKMRANDKRTVANLYFDLPAVPLQLLCIRVPGLALYLPNSYRKKQRRPPSKRKKRGKNLSPGNRKACHSVSTALMQSVAEIKTQSIIKSSRKTLHEFPPHIPPKTRKRNACTLFHWQFRLYAHHFTVTF